jgi:hypothetical protein
VSPEVAPGALQKFTAVIAGIPRLAPCLAWIVFAARMRELYEGRQDWLDCQFPKPGRALERVQSDSNTNPA